MKIPPACFWLAAALTYSDLEAASTRVEWSNAPGTELRDASGLPLTSGTPAEEDGAILQLGYYSFATSSAPFAGDWVPLTGLGSRNNYFRTIGDKGNLPAGRFELSSGFEPGSPAYGNDLPATQLPLSIRFYDATSLNATHFNAVSNPTGAWNWLTPSDSQSVINLSLSDPGLVWQGGPGSAFRTTIHNVPEPAGWAWLLMGGFLLGWRGSSCREGRSS